MKDRIKDYFAFTKKEQRGLIVLLVLMLFSVALNIFMPYLIQEETFDITPFQQEVTEFLAAVKKEDSIRQANTHYYSTVDKEDNTPVLAAFLASPFHFDPNELSEEQWIKMDMNPKIIWNIMRYQEKGGSFRNKEGLRKIYGMNDNIFSILESYIQIKGKEKTWEVKESEKETGINVSSPKTEDKVYDEVTVMIDLNLADSIGLLALYGIGPSFASRIISYRDRLGGYSWTEQLLEVWGMDSLRLAGFRNQFNIDRDRVVKIDLNKTTFKELLRHPYFEYYLVKAIFSYRDETGKIDSVGQLRNLPVMYEELYEKIGPYLKVEPMD